MRERQLYRADDNMKFNGKRFCDVKNVVSDGERKEIFIMKKQKVSGLRLYIHYLSIIFRSAMQYKVSFLLMALGQFLVSFSVFLGVYLMFMRISTVKGFTYSAVLL